MISRMFRKFQMSLRFLVWATGWTVVVATKIDIQEELSVGVEGGCRGQDRRSTVKGWSL
jgi:hypothetical protein